MAMKIRLDKLLVQRNLAANLQSAHDLIESGQLLVNGLLADKAASQVDSDAPIELRGATMPYVSRGGLKLAAGLAHFNIQPVDFTCADIGASSGGFTDCLLQHGARKVYAIDVAYGQLDWKLRQDPRVVVMERTNARNLHPGDLAEPLDLAVIDAAFISLTTLIPPLLPLFKGPISILALIKPQFEVDKGQVGKGGVVRDPALHAAVINKIREAAAALGLQASEAIPSPILGPKGNREFIIHLFKPQ